MPTYKGMQSIGENRVRRHTNALATEMVQQYGTALKEITKRADALYTKFLNAETPDPKTGYLEFVVKNNRLSDLLKRTREQYFIYAKRAGINIAQASKVAMTNNYYAQQYAASWFAPKGKGSIILDFTLIDEVAVELSVFDRKSNFNKVTNRKRKKLLSFFLRKGDKPKLSETLRKAAASNYKKIEDTIRQGLILGDSNQMMTSRLRKEMGFSTRRAAKIIRTEVNSNLNAGALHSHLNNKEQGIPVKREIISTLDIRTRRQSVQVDDKFDDENNLFTYPGGVKVAYPGNSGVPGWDVNDRETTIEIIADVKPLLRRGRNPITGETEIATFQDFSKWAKNNGLERNKFGELVT
jgi:hypothetical protein